MPRCMSGEELAEKSCRDQTREIKLIVDKVPLLKNDLL